METCSHLARQAAGKLLGNIVGYVSTWLAGWLARWLEAFHTHTETGDTRESADRAAAIKALERSHANGAAAIQVLVARDEWPRGEAEIAAWLSGRLEKQEEQVEQVRVGVMLSADWSCLGGALICENEHGELRNFKVYSALTTRTWPPMIDRSRASDAEAQVHWRS